MNTDKLFKQGEDLFYGKNGVQADKRQAFELFVAAAQEKNAFAACYVARYYEDGYNVVEISDEKRKEYDQLAADNGCATSRAILLRNDKFDDALQKELFEGCLKEAEDGFVLAFVEVGLRYRTGCGVKWPEEYKAAEWYFKAAEQGLASAYLEMDFCFRNMRDKKINGDQVKWYSRAAEQGSAKAQYELGVYHHGLSKGGKEAVEWLTKAAEQGHSSAQYTLGRIYYRQGNEQSYDKAVYWFDKAAMLDDYLTKPVRMFDETTLQNSYSSQKYLLFCHELGKYGAQSYEKVKKYYDFLSEEDSSDIQYEIAESFNNDGLYELAAKWFTKAFENGYQYDWNQWKRYVDYRIDYIRHFVEFDGKAVYKFNVDFELGIEDKEYGLAISKKEKKYVDESEEKSLSRLIEGAKQGNPVAQYNLGVYDFFDVDCTWKLDGSPWVGEDAEGVTYNEYLDEKRESAVDWYTKAAERGLAVAQNNLGVCYFFGEGAKEDFEKAADYFTKAAEQGYAKAQYHLGTCYLVGNGVEKSMKKAIEWYTKAAEQGYADAQYNLAACYYNGEMTERTQTLAFEWFGKAAEQGVAEAGYFLAQCYYFGRGTEKSIENAIKWYSEAVNRGIANAQFKLGNCYYNGDGVEQDLEKAIQCYQEASSSGLAEAQYVLGKTYIEKTDYQNAEYWLDKSIKRGNREARKLYEENKEILEKTKKDREKKECGRRRKYPSGGSDRWIIIIAVVSLGCLVGLLIFLGSQIGYPATTCIFLFMTAVLGFMLLSTRK